MEEIIPKIDRSLILEELTDDRLLRTTNKAANRIYIIDAHTAPNTMREIGRLREIAFSAKMSKSPMDARESPPHTCLTSRNLS